MPHVRNANLGYFKGSFEIGESYNGRIYTGGQEDLALGPLWFEEVLEFSPEVRYGPQPGGGIPPTSPPVPTPSNWTPPIRSQINPAPD